MKLASKNEFSRGALGGSISAVTICLLFEVFERLGYVRHCWLFMAGEPVMDFKHNAVFGAFALLIHLGVGIFWGVIIALLFSKVFSERYYMLKGLAFGAAIFFLHIGVLYDALHYPPEMREEPFTVFLIFISYLIFGGLTSLILKKLPQKEPV